MTKWKDVIGYEGLYEVSDSGLVYSRPRVTSYGRSIRGRVLKRGYTLNGYPFVILRKGGESYNELVHRLVAQALIDNPENKPQVNHIDGDKANNHEDNLEWCTQSENRQHAMDNKLHLGNGWKKKVKVTNIITNESLILESLAYTFKHFGFKKGWIQNKIRKHGNPFMYDLFIVEVLV